MSILYYLEVIINYLFNILIIKKSDKMKMIGKYTNDAVIPQM